MTNAETAEKIQAYRAASVAETAAYDHYLARRSDHAELAWRDAAAAERRAARAAAEACETSDDCAAVLAIGRAKAAAATEDFAAKWSAVSHMVTL